MRPLGLLGLLGCPDTGGAPSAAAPPPAEPPAWACTFGPLLGGAVLQPQVEPGLYESELFFSQRALPTMERSYVHSVHGRTWMKLGADGSFEACLGADEGQTASVSQYASDDGQPHTSHTDTRTLLHLRGAWAQAYDGARVTVAHMGWGDCEAPAEKMSAYGTAPLVCGSVPAAPPMPVSALACRALGQLPGLETLGLELGSSSRAGSWALRYSPMDRGGLDPAAPCGPWLLLGAAPGLTVRSEEGDRDDRPTVTLSAGVQPMKTADFLTEPR